MRIVNTFHMGVPDLGRTKGSLLAVLVQAEGAERFACYIGIVKLPKPTGNGAQYELCRTEAATQVALRGMKLNYTQALGYFPALRTDRYM